MPIDVLVLDDHRVFAEALALGIGASPGLRCTAVAHTLAAALGAARQAPVDVALVDLQLPDGDGFGAITGLREVSPGVRVVVLTAHPKAPLAHRALALGAAGFLGKDAPLAVVLAGIRDAAAGRTVLAAGLDPAAGHGVRLTPREQQVLRALGRGRDAGRIAAELGLSLHTVRDHIRAVLAKLGVRTQLDAVVTAERLGLLLPEDR